jgi:hypothetical protein
MDPARANMATASINAAALAARHGPIWRILMPIALLSRECPGFWSLTGRSAPDLLGVNKASSALLASCSWPPLLEDEYAE